jgi:hypothetical protein
MAERRKLPRKYLMYYTRVFVAGSDQLLGHLVDITPEGVMVMSEQPIPTGQTFRLKVELSPDVAEQPDMEFDATSLWCQPDVNPRFHNTGFQVHGLQPHELGIIERIVEFYGFRDN